MHGSTGDCHQSNSIIFFMSILSDCDEEVSCCPQQPQLSVIQNVTIRSTLYSDHVDPVKLFQLPNIARAISQLFKLLDANPSRRSHNSRIKVFLCSGDALPDGQQSNSFNAESHNKAFTYYIILPYLQV